MPAKKEMEVTLTMTVPVSVADKILAVIGDKPSGTTTSAAPAAQTGGKGKGKGGKGRQPAASDDTEETSQTSEEITEAQMKEGLRLTLDAVGEGPVRALFKKFKVARLSDVPADKRAAFLKGLSDARSMAE